MSFKYLNQNLIIVAERVQVDLLGAGRRGRRVFVAALFALLIGLFVAKAACGQRDGGGCVLEGGVEL